MKLFKNIKTLIIALALMIPVSFVVWNDVRATVTDLDVKTVTALGNGATTNYTIGFQFLDNTHVKVYLQDESATPYTQTEVLQGAGASKFTITGGDPGTTVVMGTAPTSTERLVIKRDVPLTQTVDYQEGQAFPVNDHEEAMDKLTMLIQTISSQVAAKIGLSDTSTATTPTFPEPAPSYVVRWNAAGDDLEAVATASLGIAASEVSNTPSGNLVATDVQAALDELQTELDATIAASTQAFSTMNAPAGTDPAADSISDTLNWTSADSTVVITGDSSTDTLDLAVGSNLANANIDAAAAIARTKLASGTADHVLINNGSGVMSSEASLAITRGGTGQATQTAGFDALAPTTTKGDVIVSNGSDNIRLAVGTDGQVLTADSAQTSGLIWSTPASAPNQPYELSNVGLAVAADNVAHTLTVSLKQYDGSTDCSGGSPCKIGFRGTTATNGNYTQRSVTSSLSLVISSGSTLGTSDALGAYIWVYAIDSDGAGTIKLAVSLKMFPDGSLQSTSAEGGAGGADSSTVLYSDAAYTSKPIRLIGRLTSTQTTAGTWDAVPTEITTAPAQVAVKNTVAARRETNSGDSITNGTTPIEVASFGTLVYDDTSSLSSSGDFTVPSSGKYQVTAKIVYDAANFTQSYVADLFVFLDGSAYGPAIGSTTIGYTSGTTQYVIVNGSAIVRALAGQVIDIRTKHGESTARSLLSGQSYMEVIRVGDY